jgi:hypothetical protein
VSTIDYYKAAFERSFSSGLDWALAQGLLLTLLFAFGLLVVAIFYTSFRWIRRRHSRAEAMSQIATAIKDFVLAAIAGTVVVLLVLFVIFFVQDAPQQMAILQRQIDGAKTDGAKSINDLQGQISAANGEITQLSEAVRLLHKQIANGIRAVQLTPLNEEKDGTFGNRIVLQFANGTDITVLRLLFNSCPQNVVPSTPGRASILMADMSCTDGVEAIKISSPSLNVFYPLLITTQSDRPLALLGVAYGD